MPERKRRKSVHWSDLIAERATQRINELELKPPELATRLQAFLGPDRWPRQAVYDLMRGKRRVDVGDLCALSQVLDRPILWFLQPDEADVRLNLGGPTKIAPPTAGSSAAATTLAHYGQLAIEDLGAALDQLNEVRSTIEGALENARTQAALAQTLDTKNGG